MMTAMSRVTNMMVNIGYDDFDNIEALSEWLRHNAREGRDGGCGYLGSITEHWGGGKAAECVLWVGALNYADHDAILDHIREMPWVSRNEVQVFLMGQSETFFRVWMFRDGELKQYAPTKPDEGDAGFFPEWED
jgi:hypothetical protein